MVFYLTNILSHDIIIDDRNSIFSQAGKNRSEYLLSTINTKTEVVSLGIPRNKGRFKKRKQEVNCNLSYYYPTSINVFYMKYLSIMLSILGHLIKRINKGDLLICYNANIMYVLPIIICRAIKKFKLVYEIEELYSNTTITKGLKHRIMNFTENYMLKNADSYIIVSEKMKEKISGDKLILLNFGYESKNKGDLMFPTSTNNIIVYCGRLDNEGGIRLFMDALNYIKTNIKVIITGSGPFAEDIKNTKFNNANVVLQFLGFVNDETLNSVLTIATVCINPMLLSHEFSDYSFPSKVLLYLSYGANVVSSKSNGILPLLNQFINLFVYEEDNAIALAEKIDEAVSTKTNKKLNIEIAKDFLKRQKKELEFFINFMENK